MLASPTERIELYEKESVLLRCGNYFAEVIQEAPMGICEIYAIHLYPDILRQVYKDEIPEFIKPDQSSVFARKIVHHSVISHFIDSLSFYFDNPELVSPELLRLKLKELILLLLQTKNADTVLELISQLFSPRHTTIQEVMQAHLYSPLTVAQLAQLAGQSLSTFKRDFHKHFNDTPANYIREKRLERAAELLQHSRYSVSEIAYEVGFNDTSHFARLFREHYKMSASAYRKQAAL